MAEKAHCTRVGGNLAREEFVREGAFKSFSLVEAG